MGTTEILWQPSPEFIQSSALAGFVEKINDKYDYNLKTYNEIWQWSVDSAEEFWKEIWNYFKIEHNGSFNKALSSEKMPGTKWFEGTEVNYAEQVFRNKTDQKPALYYADESLEIKEMSWAELEKQVATLQQHLIAKGIKKGDCVAAYLPNSYHATVSLLAVVSIGAIWSVCSPDFGVYSVIDRFSQIQPKMLIAVDKYRFNGKVYPRSEELSNIINSISSLEQVVYIGDENDNFSSPAVPATKWDEIISQAEDKPLTFLRVAFNDPMWILYSSGTTGIPKAITQSQGGVLVEHLKFLNLQCDINSNHRMFWYTTTGWIMWNLLHGALLTGASIFLYDGSLAYPNLGVLWGFVDKLKLTHFGISPGFLMACAKNNFVPKDHFSLGSLQFIGSTGSVLTADTGKWTYENVKKDFWLFSSSGGTDICSGFAAASVYLPVEAGKIMCSALGVALYSFNDDGQAVCDEPGEMVITKPIPSMPIYFWNDPDGKKYYESYFEHYEGLWRHGDQIIVYEDNSSEIIGRSDSTLNRGGVRIGTSEIYNGVEMLEEVNDSLVVNIEQKDGSSIMPLFVVLKEGITFSDELKNKIKNNLKKEYSPRHVPDQIIQVDEIPYTLSGKKMEIPIKKILKGQPAEKVLNKGSMRNPLCIKPFEELAGSFAEV